MEPYSQLVTPFILLCIALCFRATLSFLETSITALRLFRLKELAHSTTEYQSLLQTLEKSPQRVLITIIVANSFIDVSAASLATFIMGTIFTHFGLSSGFGFTLGIMIASLGIVIFGEILPKSFARVRSEQAFKSVLWLINCIYYTLRPFVFAIVNVRNVYGPTDREPEIVLLVWIGSPQPVWIHARRVEIIIAENLKRISVKFVAARRELVLGNTLSQSVLRRKHRIQHAKLADQFIRRVDVRLQALRFRLSYRDAVKHDLILEIYPAIDSVAERATGHTRCQHKEVVDLTPARSNVIAELVGQLGDKVRQDRSGKLRLISLKGDRAGCDFNLLVGRSRL